MDAIARDLSDKENTIDFLTNLGFMNRIDNDSNYKATVCSYLSSHNLPCDSNEIILQNISKRISDLQNSLNQLGDDNTLESEKCRDIRYRSNTAREKLRDYIKTNCLSQKQLEKDKDITLEKGGMALGKEKLRFERKIIFIIGGPASGKSTYATMLSNYFGAYLVDSDFIKRKIPEFARNEYGASLVHKESNLIETKIMEELISSGSNIVTPIIGRNYSKFLEMINKYQSDELKYDVYIVLISIDRGEATLRALRRFCDEKRYVPLGYVYDICGHEAIASFYRIACEHRNYKMIAIDNNDPNKTGKGKVQYQQNCNEIITALGEKLSTIVVNS